MCSQLPVGDAVMGVASTRSAENGIGSTPASGGMLTSVSDGPELIGEPDVHDDTIHLANPDPLWSDLFDRQAERIRSALGATARRVEHVGSTSVPGLAAKPIIDIVLTVPDSADEDAYVPPLEANGFVLRARERHWFEHRLLKGTDITTNLHVFTEGCSEVDRMVAFRDHLRVDDGDRRLYEATKRELAAHRWHVVQDYADAKTDVVASIMGRAAPG